MPALLLHAADLAIRNAPAQLAIRRDALDRIVAKSTIPSGPRGSSGS